MITVVRTTISRLALQRMAEESFGDLVKGVIDIRRGILAVGADLHADEEAALLEDGSKQEDLWGINLYPSQQGEAMVEFDSMINVRPRQGNRSRTLEDRETQKRIFDLVNNLVHG